MAGFLPEHLLPNMASFQPEHPQPDQEGLPPEPLPCGYGRQTTRSRSRLGSILTFDRVSRCFSATSSPVEERAERRKSILDIALQQVASVRPAIRLPPSEYCYTISSNASSVSDLEQKYRVEIHAMSSSDYRAAEAECKQLVLEAGGRLLNNIYYLGGFLFELSSLVACPIETGDQTAEGGTIVVELYHPFSSPSPVSDQSTTASNDVQQPVTLAVRGWRLKRGNRLQKKSQRKNEMTRRMLDDCDQHKVTWVELLLEEARSRHVERNSQHASDDTDWETLPDDD